MLILALIVLVIGGIILQGLKKIPNNPPHKGQATFLGKRIPQKFYNEGWGFFLFYPQIVGFILVKVERVSFEVVSEKTRTLDRSESRVPVFLTFRPLPERLIEYLNSGKEEGVKKQLSGKILERIREWAMNPEEGPSDWIELNQSHLEAVSLLIKKIASNSLTEIPDYAQEIPTWIWFRFFLQPQPLVFLKSEKQWSDSNWGKVRKILRTMSNSQISELKNAIEKRRKEIENLRTGIGAIELTDLGVTLERLNIGDIDVLGEVGVQAEGEAKEEQERQKDERELKFVRERIKELMDPPFNYTNAEARDIVQTERGKVKREIADKHYSLDSSTVTALGAIVKEVVK
jgi:hypothetical protein